MLYYEKKFFLKGHGNKKGYIISELAQSLIKKGLFNNKFRWNLFLVNMVLYPEQVSHQGHRDP